MINMHIPMRPKTDVVVIGAGPSGALAAALLARNGAEVLLVDKQNFPRDKVCGGCLNGNAVTLLRNAGLPELTSSLQAQPLTHFRLATAGKAADLCLDAGLAVRRAKFDQALADYAVERGATFSPATIATLGPADDSLRTVRLKNRNGICEIHTKAVILATGLNGPKISESHTAPFVAPASRFGVGKTADDFPRSYAVGTIYMAISPEGYVGLTRLSEGELNIAAALDGNCLSQRSLGATCGKILANAGFETSPAMLTGCWKGTSQLTRERSQYAAQRLFLIGDATGYVEPFTGEGMYWAMQDAVCVVPYVLRAIQSWSPQLSNAWTSTTARRVRRRQRMCRIVAAGLRSPTLVRCSRRLLASCPWLAKPVLARLNRRPE